MALVFAEHANDPKPETSSVLQRKSAIADGSSSLWELAQKLIDQSTRAGLYLER
jgi:hypothetical protein